MTGKIMAKSNTDTFNLGIFTGNGQSAAHEQIANLYSKHIRPDADTNKLFALLESDADFDPEVYEHVLNEVGSEIYFELEGARTNYVEASLAHEHLAEIEAVAKKHANSNLPGLNSAYRQAAQWVNQVKHSEHDHKTIMEIAERDIMDFKIACGSLEGERKTIADIVTKRLGAQYNSAQRIIDNVSPRRLLLPAPDA